MKACTKCGNRCSDDAIFCGYCGGTFAAVPRTEDRVNFESADIKGRRRKGLGAIKVSNIAMLVLNVLIMVMAVIARSTTNLSAVSSEDIELAVLVTMSATLWVIVLVFSIVVIIFSALCIYFANNLYARYDAPFKEISGTVTKLLVFVCITGVFMIVNISMISSCYTPLMAYLVLYPALVTSALVCGVIATLLAVGAIAPGIVAFVHALVIRIQLRRPKI